MYDNGKGVRQDYTQAMAWYKKPMPKAMPEPPLILGYAIITVKAYAKIKAPPKNGLAKPAIWATNKAVMNIAS